MENRRLLSFSPAVNYATDPATPSAIVTADFNNDGKLDLATCANAVTGSFSVLLGDGAGGFGAAQRTVLLSSLNSIAAADFNNDTRPDIVVSDGSGFYILMGNGNGTFQPAVSTFGGGMVAVGDFNSDNNSDVLVSWVDGDWATHIQVYRGNGQGGFAAAQDAHYWGWSAMAAVDLNNDGKLDVATGEGLAFLGNGDGSFQFDHWQPAVHSGGAIAPGDFTGEGNADVIVAASSVAVLRGRGDGTFDAPTTYPANGTAVATADFNADGKLDAVVTDADTGTVSLMLGNGDGTLRFAGAFATGISPSDVVVGDYNRDGRPDVAVSNAGWESRNVSVLLNDGVWGGSKSFVGPGGAGSGGNWSNAGNWSPAGVPTANDHISIAGKTVNLGSSATVADLTLSGGAALTVSQNGVRVLRAGTIAIGDNSKLDLKDNSLIVDYSGISPIGSGNGSAYTGITGMIQTGRTATGTWSGAGIVTSMAPAAQGVTTLAIAEAKDVRFLAPGQTALWNGQTVDATTVLVKYTYAGDLNLDGVIDAVDYGVIDNWVQFPGTNGYANGDINYDGVIDAQDYGYIDNNIQIQGPPLQSSATSSSSAAAASSMSWVRSAENGTAGTTSTRPNRWWASALRRATWKSIPSSTPAGMIGQMIDLDTWPAATNPAEGAN